MLFIFVVLGIGPRARCILGDSSTTELHPSLELHPSWPRTCDTRIIGVYQQRTWVFECVTVSCCSVANYRVCGEHVV